MSKIVDIYQALEDRGNDDAVVNHGAFLCSAIDDKGIRKKGIREPWLGEGYYFWEASIEDARWWGQTVYHKHFKGYIICHARYDRHTPYLFDLVGDVKNSRDFFECARLVAEKRKIKRVSFPLVIEYLRKHGVFNYKAIRVWPMPKNTFDKSNVYFSGNKIVLPQMNKIQVCFFDKSLIIPPFSIQEKHCLNYGLTI